MVKTIVVCLANLMVLASPMYADIYTGGGGGAIANLSTGSGILFISNPANTITTFNSINIDVTHTFVGDLTFWLVAPNGDDVQLFRQPGTGTFGDSSNLAGVYSFVNSGAAGGDFHTAAIAAGATLAPGTFNRSNVSGVTSPFTGPDPDDYSVFFLDGVSGTWTLNWRDNAVGDTGTVTSWSMDISSTAVPEPGSLIVLSLFILFGLRSRRR